MLKLAPPRRRRAGPGAWSTSACPRDEELRTASHSACGATGYAGSAAARAATWRSNMVAEDPATLWRLYMQLIEIEQAFKELKHDLAIRPIA